jgi:primosomal replication protein N|nr:MAG TPA: Single strand binding protein [Caudoviricetes sp.]
MKERNNNITAFGLVAEEPVFNHEAFGEKFFRMMISVNRVSGTVDTLPVVISDRIIDMKEIKVGDCVMITGQVRSHNLHIGEKSKLELFIFTEIIEAYENEVEPPFDNDVVLRGFICKEPNYRVTPLGREITDVLIAVNRAYGKLDYIPCIVWGRTAKFVGHLPVGTHIEMTGRFQSRPYTKKISEDEIENRVAYEVSVGRVEIIEEEENADE